MSMNNSLVATYASHSLAEATIRELRKSGFDMKKLSILGSKDQLSSIGEPAGAAVASNLSALDATQYSCIPKEKIPITKQN